MNWPTDMTGVGGKCHEPTRAEKRAIARLEKKRNGKLTTQEEHDKSKILAQERINNIDDNRMYINSFLGHVSGRNLKIWYNYPNEL